MAERRTSARLAARAVRSPSLASTSVKSGSALEGEAGDTTDDDDHDDDARFAHALASLSLRRPGEFNIGTCRQHKCMVMLVSLPYTLGRFNFLSCMHPTHGDKCAFADLRVDAVLSDAFSRPVKKARLFAVVDRFLEGQQGGVAQSSLDSATSAVGRDKRPVQGDNDGAWSMAGLRDSLADIDFKQNLKQVLASLGHSVTATACYNLSVDLVPWLIRSLIKHCVRKSQSATAAPAHPQSASAGSVPSRAFGAAGERDTAMLRIPSTPPPRLTITAGAHQIPPTTASERPVSNRTAAPTQVPTCSQVPIQAEANAITTSNTSKNSSSSRERAGKSGIRMPQPKSWTNSHEAFSTTEYRQEY